jgi:hypothetical protein
MILAVNKVINDVTISLAESIPSARTARLPDIRPAIILRIERNIFPATATHDARIIFSILKFKISF